MKKILFSTLLAAAAMLVLPATSKADSTHAAVVINDTACGVIGGVSSDSHAVITSSGNGMLTCKVQVAPPASGHAEHYDSASYYGISCNTPAGATTDWKQTTSASGEATLSCKVKK